MMKKQVAQTFSEEEFLQQMSDAENDCGGEGSEAGDDSTADSRGGGAGKAEVGGGRTGSVVREEGGEELVRVL